jgi:hypothetical protein
MMTNQNMFSKVKQRNVDYNMKEGEEELSKISEKSLELSLIV